MDPKVELLKAFCGGFVRGKAKIETEQCGFDYVDQLLSGNACLEYGELTDTRLLHKYKLANVSDDKMDELLQMHVRKECNVCRYFGIDKNNVFCFNMDNNHKTNSKTIIPEMALVLNTLVNCLRDLECEPMTLLSGRGYHVWLRLKEPIENKLLYDFMLHAAARALLPIQTAGHDHPAIKFSFYPDVKVNDRVSLRLFGSEHAKNKVFSHVLSQEGLLDEPASWQYFEHFIQNQTKSAMKFRAALDELLQGRRDNGLSAPIRSEEAQ